MTNLRVLLVDDEPLARKLLRTCLGSIPNIEILGECGNGRDAVRAVMELDPDLIFLDIQMPGMNGFDVIKALQSDAMPMVIFSTAYEQYALHAFDVHAVDYLLKPLDEERLLLAVDRARARLATQAQESKQPLLSAIEEIAEKIHAREVTEGTLSTTSDIKKLAIKDSDTIMMVQEKDIDWVDAAGDYMCIHVNGTTHIMRCTLKVLLAKLDSTIFKQIHRSTIVNLEKIEQVKSHTKGEYFLYLDCGEQLKVSRNFRDEIKSFIANTN
ncbi:LytTR family DNA-binding domain-containing protein [Zhongshania borealis]|uniref:LytTR family DNA-binding domain-containing protein n=1 Tax=Zhongshania borealis TaxID=889488 RepID=A0ABP7WAA9_9GAMM